MLLSQIWRIVSDWRHLFQIQIARMAEAECQSELEAVHMKANTTVDESLESTRRMLALCEEVRRQPDTSKNMYIFVNIHEAEIQSLVCNNAMIFLMPHLHQQVILLSLFPTFP